METYPGELLVGVFPLVFCVNATISDDASGSSDTAEAGGNAPHSRSQFERFLDALASSLMDDPEGDLLLSMNDGNPSKDAMMSLLRNTPGEESDDDELLMSHTRGRSDLVDTAMMEELNRKGTFTSPTRKSFGIGMRNKGKNSSNNSSKRFQQHNLDTSYAKALQNGQGFFQRARIVSISARHGFPPSKDPNGETNRVHQSSQGKAFSIQKLISAVKNRPVDGILPSGWLEKHAHALPSVILVVVQVLMDQSQFSKDERLLQALESLQHSLAPKRQCRIQIVGLVQKGVTPILADQWCQTTGAKLENGERLILLSVADLQQVAPPSLELQQLHKFTKQASFQYYYNQAQRTRQKLAKLASAPFSPLLLPLAIRYCFKIAMLYEFQWREEKSIKFIVEAYRYVETYYRYLLQHREFNGLGESQSLDIATQSLVDKLSTSNDSTSSSTAHSSVPDGDEVVELALHSNMSEDEMRLLKEAPAPEDMIHQCRKLADWLNFKILQSGLVSHTEGGLLTASRQWKKHSQAFCSARRSFIYKKNEEDAWIDWAYVAHQRMVVSQLLERNPPKALGKLGHKYDEILLRCSPWRTYAATAEAILRLGAEIRRQDGKNRMQSTKQKDDMRAKYVGGLGTEGYIPDMFPDESKINHRENALACAKRAISLFEREAEKGNQEDPQWKRSAARLHYLAGSTLLGLKRHADAIPFLDGAAKLCKGWSGLEVALRQMLIQCYEKHIPSSQSDENSQALGSMLLDSYFNAHMSNADLRRALGKFSTLSGGGSVKWYRDCIDEADTTLPFSFFLSFPSLTHATTGDKVKGNLLIKSNLEYAVHVNAVTLLSLAGPMLIPSDDLLSAKNADEGSNGGIIIQANSEITLSTQLQIPKDLNQIAIDETGNGGEKEGTAGKGSFSRSARPRTGGITAGAGARLVSEEEFGNKESRREHSQWSLTCLGGRPLRCDGLRVVFYPVHSAAVGDGENTIVELTIEKKYPRTGTKIKRTPFEEDNYVASAWRRPRNVSMLLGPRCLRVLSPMADMIVTNLTDPRTNGKVLEGTVNRILLRLEAGSLENCLDVKFKVKCSSFLVTEEGKTKRLVDAKEVIPIDAEFGISNEDPRVRFPILVTRDESAKGQATPYGYNLPAGWATSSNVGSVERAPAVSTLKSGDVTYAYFDVYRPLSSIAQIDGDNDDNLMFDGDLCQTDIDVSFTYRQERPALKAKQLIRRRGRKKPGQQEKEQTGEEKRPDMVSRHHSTRILWVSPITAQFTPGVRDSHPCGNSHPSNNLQDRGKLSPVSIHDELVVLDGERINTKCSLEASASEDGLMVDITGVRFEETGKRDVLCHFKLLSGKNDDGLLYKADDKDDPTNKLTLGSKFTFAWTTEANVASHEPKGSIYSSLGCISVDWKPAKLVIPEEVSSSAFADLITEHGPLQLTSLSTCSFKGPSCYVENAPFEVRLERSLASPRVAMPFDITYRIKNKTKLHQTLQVFFSDKEFEDNRSVGFLISGLVDAKVSLGPYEVFDLAYTVIATRSGKIWMPQVSVSSDRYNTWVIKEAPSDKTMLFILP